MKCPNCHFKNPDTQKFCGECGSKLEKVCSNCGSTNPSEYKFCGECGQNLIISPEPAHKELSFDEKIEKIQRYLPKGLTEKILSQRDRIEGERKQVTVMFCDMQSFTQLAEEIGPEEAYTIMDKVYEILIHKVHDFEGTVNEMTGDGIMALFGAPVALEDAPQRAIRSSLSIHREMAKFSDQLRQEKKGAPPVKMRIGIHTGPVVVGTVGNDLRVEFKAVGDTVNLASRMEGQAQPGTTYITEDTFKLTEGLFRFEGLGQRVIKGKQAPVNIYRAIAPSTRRTRFDVSAERGLTPFAGRERELELLLDGLERSKAGRGQAFSITAEAGIGKSRLLYEFRKAIASEDVTFLEGRCLSYSRSVAYHPLIDILKANFDIQEGEGDLEIREKVERDLKMLGTDEAATLPYLLELLAVKDSDIEKIPMSPEAKRDRIIEAFKQIALKGSEIRPLILAFEDLHWIDKSSEELLKYVLESIPGAKVLLLFTYRPEFVHTWGAKSYHSQLNLNRLSNRESLLMVSHLLGTDFLSKDLEEFILEKTEGVPFFIEELIKSLKDLKIIERENNRYRITKDIKEVTIPATIQDVIMARVDSLPQGTKDLLQTVSVVGRESSYELIKRVTGHTEQEILPQLSVLKDSELLYERGIYPQATYIFKHALTQDVVYDSLLLKKRKEIHAQIGGIIEALHPNRLEEHYELLAYHYGRSDSADKAVQYLYLANQKAAKLNAIEAAKAYFDEAMTLLDILPDTKKNKELRITLLLNQAYVFELLWEYPKYHEFLKIYETVAVQLANQDLMGKFYTRVGHCEWWNGEIDKAIDTSNKAIELFEATGNFENAVYAYANLVLSYWFLGDYSLALNHGEKVIRMLDSAYDPFRYVWTISEISLIHSCLGHWDKAVDNCQKALSIAKEYSNNSLISFSAWVISVIYSRKGELDRAVEYGNLAFDRAPTTNDRILSQGALGWALCRAGELSKGIDLLKQVLQMYQVARFMPSEIMARTYLGEGYWLAKEFEKSRRMLEEVLNIAEPLKMRYYIGWAHRLLGEIALKTNSDQAISQFEKSIAIFHEIKAENELALAFVSYGRLHKEKGQIAKSREYLSKALEIFERLGTSIEPENIRKILAELPEE
jgi:class 3 adenylate cyclase/tetratricopeptide (TPR) repeat protein